MDIVEQWINRHVGMGQGVSAGDQALSLIHSRAWEELAEGALGHLAYDAGKRMGAAGLPWIESASPAGFRHARRMALRAVWAADMDELARWCPHLDAQEGCRALEVMMSDPRCSQSRAWAGIQSSWPLALDAVEAPTRTCSDWEVLASLASRNPQSSTRCAVYFSKAMGVKDESGATFAQAWIRQACKVGSAIDACASALSLSAHAVSAPPWLLEAKQELAASVGFYMEAQVEPRSSCSSSTYWQAWGAFGLVDAGPWRVWIRKYWSAVKRQSTAARRSAGCSCLWEALAACRREGVPIPADEREEFFGLLCGIAKMHFEAWAPTSGDARDIQSTYHREAIGAALSDWSSELGPPKGGWAKRVRDLALVLPELGARLEARLISEEAPRAHGQRDEQAAQETCAKRL